MAFASWRVTSAPRGTASGGTSDRPPPDAPLGQQAGRHRPGHTRNRCGVQKSRGQRGAVAEQQQEGGVAPHGGEYAAEVCGGDQVEGREDRLLRWPGGDLVVGWPALPGPRGDRGKGDTPVRESELDKRGRHTRGPETGKERLERSSWANYSGLCF